MIVSRTEALARGLKRYFTGKPCKRRHVAERHTANKACSVCLRERHKKWRQANPQKVAATIAAWRARNPEKELERKRRQLGLPCPPRPAPVLCECCGRPPGQKALALDHDHETGAFRGWLCFKCNSGIGKLGDSLEGLQQAVRYLSRASEWQRGNCK